MYELALRVQDATMLTYSHFMSVNSRTEQCYFLEFKSNKTQSMRKIEVQWRLHAKIFDYRSRKEAAGEKTRDADPILGF